jgi:S-layer protein
LIFFSILKHQTWSLTNGANATTIAGVEVINITTNDTDTTAATTAFLSVITATSATTVNISGDAGFNATGMTATTLTSFDASGVTATGAGGAVTLTTGALAAAATLTGGAGTNTIDAGAATKAVTLTGGAGLDALSGGAGADTINGGNGGTTGVGLVGGAGVDTITGGTGTDTIAGGAGNDTISGDAGVDTITGGADNDTIDGGAGNDSITGGTGADTLTGGAGVDTFIFSTVGDSSRLNLDTISDLSVGTTTSDSITLANRGTEVGANGTTITATKSDVSLASTLIEALNLVSTGDGSTHGIVKWFQYDGNTYLVEDRSSEVVFDDVGADADIAIKITGIVDLLSGTDLALTFA